MSFGAKLRLLKCEKRPLSGLVNLPDFIVETIIVVVIEIFVLPHPVCELGQLECTSDNVDVVLFEDIAGKLLHDVMDAGCFYLHIIVSHLELQSH